MSVGPCISNSCLLTRIVICSGRFPNTKAPVRRGTIHRLVTKLSQIYHSLKSQDLADCSSLLAALHDLDRARHRVAEAYELKQVLAQQPASASICLLPGQGLQHPFRDDMLMPPWNSGTVQVQNPPHADVHCAAKSSLDDRRAVANETKVDPETSGAQRAIPRKLSKEVALVPLRENPRRILIIH